MAGRLGAPILSLDSYYRDMAHLPLEERARTNFDEPGALDADLLIAQVRSLASGDRIERPVYDFARHTRAPEIEELAPAEYVIVEGLFTLYWEALRRLYGTKVYVEADDALCFARRMERDVRERGRSPESVRWQYNETVRPMAERYVYPARLFADVIVSGTAPLAESAALVLSHLKNQGQ